MRKSKGTYSISSLSQPSLRIKDSAALYFYTAKHKGSKGFPGARAGEEWRAHLPPHCLPIPIHLVWGLS